jgi:dolichol kinase
MKAQQRISLKKRKNKSITDYKKEVKRAVFHIATGLIIIVLSLFISIETLIMLLSVVIIGGLICSILSRKYKMPVINMLLKNFEREENEDFPGKGSFYFVAGCLFSLLLFEKQIALAAIMVLTFGDSFTNIFGPLGKIKTRLHAKKRLEGTIIGIIAGTLGAMWFVTPIQAFFGTLIAMIGEMIDFKYLQINDNVFVPIVAGIFMKLLIGI